MGLVRGSGVTAAGKGFASAVLALLLCAAAGPAEAAPLDLHYNAYVAGLPLMSIDFRLQEAADSYEFGGLIKARGLFGVISNLTLRSSARGRIARDAPLPSHYESLSDSRRGTRTALLEFGADGPTSVAITPTEEPDRVPPTPEQIKGSVDPLTGFLMMSRTIARTGRCGQSVAIFDGRRRYDLLLIDDGTEQVDRAADLAYVGEARRCLVHRIKIAGFTNELGPQQSDRGQVLIAPAHGDTPPLPLRVDFDSDWGAISIRKAEISASN
jgi:hypothetical protein